MVVEAVVGVLRSSKDGLRSEQIQQALGLSKKDLVRPIQLALSSKAIKKKGERRATSYFAA